MIYFTLYYKTDDEAYDMMQELRKLEDIKITIRRNTDINWELYGVALDFYYNPDLYKVGIYNRVMVITDLEKNIESTFEVKYANSIACVENKKPKPEEERDNSKKTDLEEWIIFLTKHNIAFDYSEYPDGSGKQIEIREYDNDGIRQTEGKTVYLSFRGKNEKFKNFYA